MTLQLVDLSNNNPEPDWAQLAAAGVAGCWLKVTEGLGFIDPTWLERRHAATVAGLRVGGYHFAHPDQPAAKQAQLFAGELGTIGPHDLRPALDLEQTGGVDDDLVVAWARAFNQRLVDLVHVGPLFYTFTAFAHQLAPSSPIGYGLWLADYGPDDGSEHPAAPPAPWKHLVAHQYTSKGQLAGITGDVDRTSAAELRPLLAHPPPAV